MMDVDHIEDALRRVKRFRTNEPDSLEFELLDKLSAETRLIEAVILNEELWLQDVDMVACYNRYLAIGKYLGYDVSNKATNYRASYDFCDAIASVTRYLEALMFLADYDLD